MSEGPGNIRSVVWTELLPWLMLFRVFRFSISVPILFLATLGTCLIPIGWNCSDALFLTAAERASELGPVIASNGDWAVQGPAFDQDPESGLRIPTSWDTFLAPVARVFTGFVDPFRQLLRTDLNFRLYAYFAFGANWNLLLWAFFGGVISRIAVVRFGREEREGMFDAVVYVARRFVSYFAAPLFPLVGVAIVVLFSYPVGLCLRADTGVLIASLLWIFVILGGLILTVLLTGLLFGWT